MDSGKDSYAEDLPEDRKLRGGPLRGGSPCTGVGGRLPMAKTFLGDHDLE